MSRNRGGVISTVSPGGLGELAGLQPGDRLTAINGQPVRDVIDFRYYSAEEHLELLLDRDGKSYTVDIERDYGAELGIEFSDLVFDGMRLCRNRCPFCFVDQMPTGLRPSLYLHDDDYRYSFLHGNFITLTNLTEDDWQRIGEQGLSPLYVSIHATDLAVRRRLLGNPRAPDIVYQLNRLSELGIEVHGQVVIWPGVNDGAVLRQTIDQVAGLWPAVETLAIVPVGLTRCQSKDIRRVTAEEARAILDLAEEYRVTLRQRCDCTWLYPADELYLLADRAIPPASFYDDEAQWQNGVGLVRELLDDWQRTKRKPVTETPHLQDITLASGELIAPTLTKLTAELVKRLGVNARVIPIPNRLFGSSVTVSGLLSGADLLETLHNVDLGQHLFLPRVMFSTGDQITLDDIPMTELSSQLLTPVSCVSLLSEVVARVLNPHPELKV
jgi:putative radical SAM enzyme (TIGR03279 family)